MRHIEEEFARNGSSKEPPSDAPLDSGSSESTSGMNTRSGGDFCDETAHTVTLKDGTLAALRVRFSDVLTVRGATTGKISVWMKYDDGSKSDSYIERINLAGGRDALARQLKDAFPIKESWPLMLSRIFSDLSEKMRGHEMESVKMVSEIVPAKSFHLLEPFIEYGVANLIFAKGSVGKTTFTVAVAISIILGKEFLGKKPTKKMKVLFIDYENSEESFRDKVERIGRGYDVWNDSFMDDIFYKESHGLPLSELADELKALVEEKGIGLIIVDSAVPAIGGAPEDAACAALYFNALRKIGLTSVTIAHEPKASTDGMTAFGSVFFMNLSRNAWNLQSDEPFTGATKKIVAKHRKYNNGPLFDDITYSMTSVPSSITFTMGDDSQRKKSNREKVREALSKFGEMSIAKLADITSVRADTLRPLLSRMEENKEVETLANGKRKLIA